MLSKFAGELASSTIPHTMSPIQTKIAEILDGFRSNYSQIDETANLLERYFKTLPLEKRAEFFDTLWSQYVSEPISHLSSKRTAHTVIVRVWLAFGPADQLPSKIFSRAGWDDPKKAESWAIVLGGYLVHSIWTYRDRLSNTVLNNIKEQCALYLSPDAPTLFGVSFPAKFIEIAQRLDEVVNRIIYERKMAEIKSDPATAKPPRKSESKNVVKSEYGRWNIVESLSEGGQGHIFEVQDTKEEFVGHYALKKLKNSKNAERRKRFIREVKITQSIDHPNVLKIIDSDVDSRKPYYVAELCVRGSLEKIGAPTFKGNIRVTVDTLLPVIDALVAVHRAGAIHRDIKPANILLREDGTPLVGDFGICFVEDGELVTLADEGVGSRNFIAPEMESGQRDLGEPSDRTDVYSLGKVIYWMLSGGLEFSREDHRKTSLVTILMDQRFEHVHSFLDQLVVREPKARISSYELKEKLEMTASLVEGDYAPLSPSIGIRCRFCGIGKYKALPARPGFPISQIGLALTAGTDVRAMNCSHCGHVQIFQFLGIDNPKWWEK
jgi:tRNA A-37 threonylcarbamoyl transferase component Bud32